MSSNDNPIIEDSPDQLKSMDEFENERTSLLVKQFHSSIKQELKDQNKQFILLVNSDISFKKYRSIWSNDPKQKDKLFAELTEKEDLKNPVVPPDMLPDDQNPRLVPIYTAEASDYYTDPETGLQHFPENIFNYDNNNDWKSVIDEPKELKIIFQKDERIKYLVIDFLDSGTKQYDFEIGYFTGDKDQNGEKIYRYLRDPKDSDKRLVVTTELKDNLQLVDFKNPIFSKELLFNFTSKEAGVNYMFIIGNDLSKDAISAFFELKAQG